LEATEVVTLDEHEILGREEHVVFLLSNIVTVTEGVPETKLTSGGQDCEGTEIHETARMSKALIETEVVTVGVQELGEKELHGAKTCLCSITLTATNEEVLTLTATNEEVNCCSLSEEFNTLLWIKIETDRNRKCTRLNKPKNI